MEGWKKVKHKTTLHFLAERNRRYIPGLVLLTLLEVARALATEPRFLILDEPAGGMNDQETADLIGLIQAIRSRGIAVLLIEHDMHLVMQVCEKLVVLEYGAVIAEGTPAEIKANPLVIKAYLGSEELD